MASIEELIRYWKDRLSSIPPLPAGPDREAIRDTIAYLEKLKETKHPATD